MFWAEFWIELGAKFELFAFVGFCELSEYHLALAHLSCLGRVPPQLGPMRPLDLALGLHSVSSLLADDHVWSPFSSCSFSLLAHAPLAGPSPLASFGLFLVYVVTSLLWL